MLYKIDENGVYVDFYPLVDIPIIEVNEEWIEDPSYIDVPIPNDIYHHPPEHPAKWTGSEWVATAEPPEPLPALPTIEERLETAEAVLLEIMMMG